MVTVKLYVEGGGNRNSLRSGCREGFRKFLENGFKGRMPRVVACGSRRDTYEDFKTACEKGDRSLMLIDSEDFVTVGMSPWQHLANRQGDGFTKPPKASDEHCHFMVVCMESWFLADKEILARYFDQGFNEKSLPQNLSIEGIAKNNIFSGLKAATSDCKTKGQYEKGRDSFKILGLLTPDKISAASPWAKRFFDHLEVIMK